MGHYSPYTAVAVQNFAGGFACGATLAGFSLRGNLEQLGGFGVPLMEANRPFLGDKWESQVNEPEKWEPVKADLLVSNPPCSAFSGMTAGYSVHGMDSPINDCMWHTIRYAAKVRPAIMIMESVTQAFTNGKLLMHRLAEELCRLSGLAYRTTHVLQNNYSLGGVTQRKRYFLVLSIVPFGVELPELKWLPVVGDALSDLKSMPQRWERQPYTSPPTWWSHQLRSADGAVDGHYFAGNRHTARLLELVDGLRAAGEEPWLPGEPEERIPERYYAKFGKLPEAWQYENSDGLTREKQLIDRNFKTGGFAQTRYWPWDKPGRVINGAGPHMIWHPDGRQTTHREVARLMGFPDNWRIAPVKDDTRLHSYWGKGTSVAPAQWICDWAKESLDGSPGAITGEKQLDGSYLIDVSSHWRTVEHRIESPLLQEPLSVPATPTVPDLTALKPRRSRVASPKSLKLVKPAGIAPKSPSPASQTPAKPRRRVTLKQAEENLVPAGFRVRPEDEYVVREVFSGHIYRQLTVRRGDRILDLGAHTGTFTRYALSQHAAHVTAVEMMPPTFAILEENTAGLPVELIQAAVAREAGDGVAVFTARANPMKASLLGARITDVNSPRYLKTAVTQHTLRHLIDTYGPFNTVKFSIEGSEGLAITPYATFLAANGVTQVIGIHHVGDDSLLERSRELHDALTAAGYRASRPAPAKPTGWPPVIHYQLKRALWPSPGSHTRPP